MEGQRLIDVRSPSEYRKGHIPGAVNVPLFSDAERKEIGTIFKNFSSMRAIQKGFEIALPRTEQLVAQIQKHVTNSCTIYCWRGGMRSLAVTELLKGEGVQAEQLPGGYKSFRRQCEELFSRPLKLRLLGGLSGCGKTERLKFLQKKGKQTIDLEALANHRGGCFGHIGMGPQPTTEHFHNLIASELSRFNLKKTIWIEQEGRLLGSCHLPESLYKQMQEAPVEILDCSMEERLERLNSTYGSASPEEWITAVEKLRKRLGSEKTKTIIDHINSGRLRDAALLVLAYYDKCYSRN